MISVELLLDAENCLKRISAVGHASGEKRGSNVVCGAATILMRSAARVIAAENALDIGGSADREGIIDIQIRRIADDKREWLRGVSDVLREGLRSLAADHPGEVRVTVENE